MECSSCDGMNRLARKCVVAEVLHPLSGGCWPANYTEIYAQEEENVVSSNAIIKERR